MKGAFIGMAASIDNAKHYIWGEVCESWHLLKRDDMSIIQERVPAGAGEVMHYHTSREYRVNC